MEVEKPHLDAFGTPRDKDGKVVVDVPKQPEFIVVDGAKYVNDGTGKPKLDDKGNRLPFSAPKEEKPAETIEDNPVVKELRTQLAKSEKDRESMGKSLSEQRKAFETRLEKLEKGEKPKDEPVFKEVRRVKDLPKADQEAMTDAEKRLFDQNADMMDTINRMAAAGAEKDAKSSEERDAAERKAGEEKAAKQAAEDFQAKVQERVMKLTGNDQALANKIIKEFNEFKDSHLLVDDELQARIEKAAKLVPEYKPKEHQQTPQGAAVKSGGSNDDPFGNDEAINQASSQFGGRNYSL